MTIYGVEVDPETLWHQKLKFWPSAVLAEFAIRIHTELRARASHYEKLSRNKNHHPEQEQQADQA